MLSFAVRPGYQSQELLIEFRKGSGSDEMAAALREALAGVGVEVKRKEDLWQNDEILYHMSSEVGAFQLSSDNYGCVFILAPENQPAIEALATALSASGLFEREAVDFGAYT